MNQRAATLAIIVKCWPRLSETFVAQELVALEERDQQFDVWSLRHPANHKQHPLHERLTANVRYLPEYLHHELPRVIRSWWVIRQLPGYADARRVFWCDFKRDKSRNRFRRFGQACVLAAELSDNVRALYAHFLHTPSSVARYAAIMQGLPWSFSAHAKDIWTSPEWEIREKLNPSTFGADFGVSCTANGTRYLRARAANPDRIDLVYHGLDLSRFPLPPQRPAVNSSSSIQLLSVGRLVEKKGYDRLIAALAHLPATLNWHWTHIGGGELKQLLLDQARQLGMVERISWMGECEQPQVIQAMAESDIFILPSRIALNGDRDGLPNVLMEAASQKLPIISTDVSAIPEFIQHRVHGLLVDDAPEQLAAAIVELASDPRLRAQLAETAYHRLVEEFGIDAGIMVLDHRLRDMCGRSG